MKDVEASPQTAGRRALAAAYLGLAPPTSDNSSDEDRAAVDALLWTVECEVPAQAAWMYTVILPLFPWSDAILAWMKPSFASLQSAVELLRRAETDPSLKARIVADGVLRVAAQQLRDAAQ